MVEVRNMKQEYDIKNLNPRKNPYAKQLKRQITINIDGNTIDFFKAQSIKNRGYNTVLPVFHTSRQT